MVASGDAAGDLHVDDAVLDAVATDHLAHQHGQHRGLDRPHDVELAQRAVEAHQMPFLVDQPAAEHGDDLVDPVGELVAAVLDMHRGAAMRLVAAVDVGDARHGCL